MDKHEKPLPRPPKTPFGRKRADPEQHDQALLADRMAEAAALGKLDEFLEHQLPDSEHARALASMMMGMTGMLPQAMGTAPVQQEQNASASPVDPSQDTPAGVREAVQAGDVKGLVDLLKQEHRKRVGGAGEAATEEREEAAPPAGEIPEQEREVLDQMIALAREHKVSPDWIILRALKLYIEEYKRTGRL